MGLGAQREVGIVDSVDLSANKLGYSIYFTWWAKTRDDMLDYDYHRTYQQDSSEHDFLCLTHDCSLESQELDSPIGC